MAATENPAGRSYVLDVDGTLVRVEARALSPTTRLALNDAIREIRSMLAEADSATAAS